VLQFAKRGVISGSHSDLGGYTFVFPRARTCTCYLLAACFACLIRFGTVSFPVTYPLHAPLSSAGYCLVAVCVASGVSYATAQVQQPHTMKQSLQQLLLGGGMRLPNRTRDGASNFALYQYTLQLPFEVTPLL
jgi:hypothetical protein